MTQVPMTFFSSHSSRDQLYVKSTFKGVDCFYTINQICGLNRVVSAVAEKNLQPIFDESVINFLSLEKRSYICNNLLFIHQEYEKALFKMTTAINIILNKNSGERQALSSPILSAEVCENITELNLSNCGLEILPPQIELFKNLQHLILIGNNLKSLPVELKSLPIQKINLTGNTWLQPNLPKWIDQIASVTLPNGTLLEKKSINNFQLFQGNNELSFHF